MVKKSTNQNFILVIVLLLSFLSAANLGLAQCLNNNNYYTDLTTTFDGDINSDACVYGGDYCTADVCEGVTYIFSTCGASYDTQITLYSSTGTYLDYDDDGCGISNAGSYLEWVSTFTGTVWIVVDLYNCTSNSTCSTLSVTQNGSCAIACGNNNTLYNINATPSGTGNTVSVDCTYAGEYLNVNVCAGADYTFTTCGASYDTQLSLYSSDGTLLGYDDDACGTNAGSTIDWTATLSGTVRILLDQYPCSSNTTCTTVAITQNTSCSSSCSFTDVNSVYDGCLEDLETAIFYPYYTGSCTIAGMYIYTVATGWTYIDLAVNNFVSGDGISFLLPEDNTLYTYSFVLDDAFATESDLYEYTTSECPLVGGCEFTNIDAISNGCYVLDETFELVNFYADYTGSCGISSIILENPELGQEIFDLSADGLVSGDAIGILLALDNAVYDYYFVLSDGTQSEMGNILTGECGVIGGCSFVDIDASSQGCYGLDGNFELANFTAFYSGDCTVQSLELYSFELGIESIDLSLDNYTSGDPIGIILGLDNTEYAYYFVLSDGTESATSTIITGECVVESCVFNDVFAQEQGCDGESESVNFYAIYSGGCTISSIWFSANNGPFQQQFLNGNLTSGDAVGVLLAADNTYYELFFQLSDGTQSDVYSYTTGICDVQNCSGLQIDYSLADCAEVGGNLIPSGIISPFYTGDCQVEGVYSSVNNGVFEYLDLSAYNYFSGDDIELLFNIEEGDYEVYYVLSDGSESPIVSFTNVSCASGITICDCIGTQLPLEAFLAWHGDNSLDDGTYFWNSDPTLPVNFNCATWGFDCNDGQAADAIFFDPYGTCAGNLPPANGCVDEFCYGVDIVVATDCFPLEVGVSLYDQNGALTLDIPFGTFTEDYTEYTYSACLPAGCYTFEISDEYGDGLSNAECNLDGYFGLIDPAVGVLIDENGDAYLTSYSQEFCVGPETVCNNLEISINDAPCSPANNVLLPAISYQFNFSGNCTVQSIFYSIDGADFIELDVSANNWTAGDEGFLYYLVPGASYTVYYTTEDGAISLLYDFVAGDCNNEISICDCAGTQHSIGVLAWLGDGFADNGFYEWLGEPVDFNCSTWGYDCSDIEGAPSFDPFNVCDGQLPPFNGCVDNNDNLGCTDPDALNYNPAATINNGSCIYNEQIGCTESGACNYSANAIVDDGSCEFISCAGCTDIAAVNYDETATISDGSCIYQNIEGCTDDNALNYDPIANEDDGSCIYGCIWPSVTYDAHCTEGDLTHFYIDVDVTALGNGAPYTITNSDNNQQQVMTLTGSVTMGPFDAGTTVVVLVTSNSLDCIPLTSTPLTLNCSVAGIYGCTDATATNYNVNATIDDGSCIFAISGCTNPIAINYNALATTDDGSCVFSCIAPTVLFDAHCTVNDLNNFYVDIEISALGNGAPYTIANSSDGTTETITAAGMVTIGPFISGIPVFVSVTSGTLECPPVTSTALNELCSGGGIYGCTDTLALNYNPLATINDGSCVFSGVEVIEQSLFRMYPNPTSNFIAIENNGHSPLLQIQISESTGRLVKTEQANINYGGMLKINVSDLAQGNYIVSIISDGRVEHHSFIVQR